MICDNPRPHDPHSFQRPTYDASTWPDVTEYCEGRTAPAPPSRKPVAVRGRELTSEQLGAVDAFLLAQEAAQAASRVADATARMAQTERERMMLLLGDNGATDDGWWGECLHVRRRALGLDNPTRLG